MGSTTGAERGHPSDRGSRWATWAGAGSFAVTALSLFVALTGMGDGDFAFLVGMTLYVVIGAAHSLRRHGAAGLGLFILGSIGGIVMGFASLVVLSAIASLLGGGW